LVGAGRAEDITTIVTTGVIGVGIEGITAAAIAVGAGTAEIAAEAAVGEAAEDVAGIAAGGTAARDRDD
jgi:hypothetical protein